MHSSKQTVAFALTLPNGIRINLPKAADSGYESNAEINI